MSAAAPALRPPAGPALVGAVFALAALAAVALGILVAAEPRLGAVAAAGLVYVAIVVRSPALGVALWVPAFSLSFLPAGNALLRAGVAGALLALLVVEVRSGRLALPALRHRLWLSATLALLVWAVASVAWASSPGLVVSEAWRASLAVLAGIAVVWVTSTRRHAIWIAAAVVAGPMLSATIGIAGGDAVDRFAAGETFGRLTGGSGDANQLAAGLVPAVALAVGLVVAVRTPAAKLLAGACVPLAVVAIALTESRGGVIALAVVLLAMLLLFRGARGTVLVVVAIAGLALAGALAMSPSATSRLTDLDADGTGRTELWRVGAQMSLEHPFGVGLNGFRAAAPSYALDPGFIDRLNLIVERPVVVHNTYLQLTAELGIAGLLLFLAVVALSLRASVRAAHVFERLGDRGTAALARASAAALVGFLAASVFVSFGFSYRMWVLLALGPALLGVAAARGASAVREAAS